jgi:hypothetical protein
MAVARVYFFHETGGSTTLSGPPCERINLKIRHIPSTANSNNEISLLDERRGQTALPLACNYAAL